MDTNIESEIKDLFGQADHNITRLKEVALGLYTSNILLSHNIQELNVEILSLNERITRLKQDSVKHSKDLVTTHENYLNEIDKHNKLKKKIRRMNLFERLRFIFKGHKEV